ncbi:MAG: hypothetical protein ABIR24_12835, partial [Verrucomicrobiota bacterium]
MKKLTRKLSLLATIMFLSGCVPSAFAQTLTHRYTFNDTAGNPTFADSVGGASWDGSIVGSATLNGTNLVLDGVGGFATVPGGIISTNVQVSIEFWA